MRVAALYDIHGNLPALEAVLQEVRKARVDQVVVGGDVVPGPMALEALALSLSLDLPLQFIQGNCEEALLAERAGRDPGRMPQQARDAIRWTAQRLPAEHERVVAAWPATLRLEVAGLGPVVFCHGTPRSATEIFTRFTPEYRLLPILEGLGAAVVVCGHTHMQFDRMVGRTRVVNAGSVGMPFGKPGAYWLLLRPEVHLRSTAYDLEDAARRIRATSYPGAEDFAARNVLQPPAEAAMLEVFAGAERDAAPAGSGVSSSSPPAR